MTDIVERLRGKFLVGSVDDSLDPLLNEAADEIERLRGYLNPLIKEILHRKPYRRSELYKLATIADIGMDEARKKNAVATHGK